MLQHDLHRTGYFNFSAKGGCDTSRDFQIVDVYSENASVLSEGNRIITVDVLISGTGETDSSINCASIVNHIQSNAPVIAPSASTSASIASRPENCMSANTMETVSVALFNGSQMACVKRIPLVDGLSSVALSVAERELDGEVTVAVDPFGEYQEADETNNIMSLGITTSGTIEYISIASSSKGITITVPAGLLSNESATASLFSIDGRLVNAFTAQNSTGQGFSTTLGNSSGSLPFGCYVILLTDGDGTILRRKVLVID